MIDFPVPIIGVVAWSGTGKTTLLRHVIPILRSEGLNLALVKHAHHHFDIDHPGKDSYVLREAGANEVIIASRHRIASIREIPGNREEPCLKDILKTIQADGLDLVLVEGFKMEDFPKIELHRKGLDRPYLYPEDKNIIALAEDTDTVVSQPGLEKLNIGMPEEIAAFIMKFVDVNSNKSRSKARCTPQGLRSIAH